jgi:hypothetical protein
MSTRAPSFGNRLRTAPPRDEPIPHAAEFAGSEDHGLAKLGRDAGLKTPDAVATPDMSAQTGLSIA